MNTTTPPDDALPQNSIIYKLLESFHLYHTAGTWTDITQKAAQENLSYQDFLTRILFQEASIKHAKTVKRLIREARFPTIKTIDSFDWHHPSKIDRQTVLNAIDISFVQSKGNLIFVGHRSLSDITISAAISAFGLRLCKIFLTYSDEYAQKILLWLGSKSKISPRKRNVGQAPRRRR